MNKLKRIGAAMQERALLKRIYGHDVNHAEGGEIVAPITTNRDLMRVGQGRYNPPFKAQIQVQVLKYYFTEAAGVYTEIASGALHGTLQVDLPVFLFAPADFESGYAKLFAQYPITGWTFNPPVKYGKDQPTTPSLGDWDATVTNKLQRGDVVLPYTATAGGNDYLGIIVVRTSDVPYTSLLTSAMSNTFKINMIRYKVTAGQESQYAKALGVSSETMFGRFTSDPINPEAFINPEQEQDNIVDMDVTVDINKEKGLATYVIYTENNFRWNLFIADATKIV